MNRVLRKVVQEPHDCAKAGGKGRALSRVKDCVFVLELVLTALDVPCLQQKGWPKQKKLKRVLSTTCMDGFVRSFID